MRGNTYFSFTGNFAGDPIIREVGEEKKVAKFSVAVNGFENGEEVVHFRRCEAWNKTAEIIERFCTKGSGAFVSGNKIKDETWQDKEGQERKETVYTVRDMVLAGGPAQS